MKFKSIELHNFRNFENISINLDNRNIFFGMNDVGKTNFLYALRFIFDKEIRKNGFQDSDFFQKDVDRKIGMLVTIDISDKDNIDSQKLRAQIGKHMMSGETLAYIELVAAYDRNMEEADFKMYWGGQKDKLHEMNSGSYFYDIDRVFNVVYIDAYVNLQRLFKRNSKSLVKNENGSNINILKKIEDDIVKLNDDISSLPEVKNFENRITPEYKKFRNENVNISIKSEMAVNGLYSNVVPYIKKNGDDNLYPTAGEGRKKLLVYALYSLLSQKESDKKINLFLVEEPENHLHRSMQIALSRALFQTGTDSYKYLFVTTHSTCILSNMDQVNLVRIYNADKIQAASSFYSVPGENKSSFKLLNRGIAEAVFADEVLLVEGPSENLLFSRVLSCIAPDYELEGKYILPINGIGFKPYVDVLKNLKIKTIIKTDNDLKYQKSRNAYEPLGFKRISSYLGTPDNVLPRDDLPNDDVQTRRKLYDDNADQLKKIEEKYHIYLSHCGLEEDLCEVLGEEKLDGYLGCAQGKAVSVMQRSKNREMYELIKYLSDEDCIHIYNHKNFACLKDLIEPES